MSSARSGTSTALENYGTQHDWRGPSAVGFALCPANPPPLCQHDDADIAMTKTRTKTFSALKKPAAFAKRSHAESSRISADGARLIDGHCVTIEPRMIYACRGS